MSRLIKGHIENGKETDYTSHIWKHAQLTGGMLEKILLANDRSVTRDEKIVNYGIKFILSASYADMTIKARTELTYQPTPTRISKAQTLLAASESYFEYETPLDGSPAKEKSTKELIRQFTGLCGKYQFDHQQVSREALGSYLSDMANGSPCLGVEDLRILSRQKQAVLNSYINHESNLARAKPEQADGLTLPILPKGMSKEGMHSLDPNKLREIIEATRKHTTKNFQALKCLLLLSCFETVLGNRPPTSKRTERAENLRQEIQTSLGYHKIIESKLATNIRTAVPEDILQLKPKIGPKMWQAILERNHKHQIAYIRVCLDCGRKLDLSIRNPARGLKDHLDKSCKKVRENSEETKRKREQKEREEKEKHKRLRKEEPFRDPNYRPQPGRSFWGPPSQYYGR